MDLKETAHNLIERAKALPLWVWLLIGAAVVFVIWYVANGGGASLTAASPVDTSGAPPGGDTTPPPLTPDPIVNIPPIIPDPGSDGGDNGVIDQVVHTLRQEWRDPTSSGAPPPPINYPGDTRGHGKNKGDTSGLGDSTSGSAGYSGDTRGHGKNKGDTSGLGAGPEAYRTHAMQPGETLHSVAYRYDVAPGDLYAANQDNIEAAARQRGFPHSDGGTFVFPGHRLTIPN